MHLPKCFNLLRPEPHYRADAFTAGLRAANFEVVFGQPSKIQPGDALLIWNRYGSNHDLATKCEAGGGMVIVAENGYIGPGGVSPHSMAVREPYALARGYHNDSTVISDGRPERWAALGIDLKPWRADGGHVLVLPNRPFGAPGRAMPANWAQDIAGRLAKLTKREIRIRAHPGNAAPVKPLADDLAGAWCTVIWSSSAGVHSLIAGVPVICEAPFWICKEAAGNLDQVESPPMPNRLPALQRLAWGQWSIREIESGEPFRRLLLPHTEQAESAAAL